MPATYAQHRAQIKAILLAWGMPEDNTDQTSDVLAWADLRGVDSHDISLLPGCAETAASGWTPAPRSSDRPSFPPW